MTLTRFVTKSAFRNKRRSLLTVLSITFSLLLLTLMMTIWRAFYIDTFSAESAQRLVTRHRVSLTESMPSFYREKIRAIPGVVAVAPNNWFGGIYKDSRSRRICSPSSAPTRRKSSRSSPTSRSPRTRWRPGSAIAPVPSSTTNSPRNMAGSWAIASLLQGTIYPMELDLTIRGIYTAPEPTESIYFNQKYVEEAVSFANGRAGMFAILADSPDRRFQDRLRRRQHMFRNSPEPTKTESEKAFQLSFINSIGNVKAFILSICFAVVFATLLVSATTMAMSIRERTREVAVLKTLGFTRQSILRLYIGEAVLVALTGGALGCLLALVLVSAMSHAPGMSLFLSGMKVTLPTLLLAIIVAGMVGFLSAILPAYHAAKLDIVEGLRYVG